MAITGYTEIAIAVKSRFVEHFPEELNTDLCQVSDLDALLNNLNTTSARYGCILEFSRGRRQKNETFKDSKWVWRMVGVFMIRYNPDVEEQARLIIDKIATVFDDDPRLGYKAALAEVVQIEKPVPERVNDVPFYWIPFAIEMWDKG